MDLIQLTVVSINGKNLTTPTTYGFDVSDIVETITNDGTYSRIVVRSIKGIDQQKRSLSKVVYEVSEDLATIVASSDHLFLCDVTYRNFTAVSYQAVFVADHVSGGFYTASGPATTFYYAEDGAPDLVKYVVTQTVAQIVAQTAIVIPNAWVLGGNTVASLQKFGTLTNFPIPFYVNNIERMRLTTTGLGIGTTTPGYKLDVNTGATETTGIARFANTKCNFVVYASDATPEGNITADRGDICVVDDGAAGQMYIKLTGNATNTGWALMDSSSSDWSLNGNTVGAEKWFGTIDNFEVPLKVNNTEVARLFSNGLLIGTNTPFGTEVLGVSGDVYIDGKLTVTGIIDPTQIQFTGLTTPDGTKYEIGFDVDKMYFNVPTAKIFQWRINNIASSVINQNTTWTIGDTGSYPAQLAVYNSSGSTYIQQWYASSGALRTSITNSGSFRHLASADPTLAANIQFTALAKTFLCTPDSSEYLIIGRYGTPAGGYPFGIISGAESTTTFGEAGIALQASKGGLNRMVLMAWGDGSVSIEGTAAVPTVPSAMFEVRSNSAAKHVASFFGNTSGDEAFRVQDGLESIAFGGLYGGTSVAADLVLNSTTNAVKGRVLIANSTLNIEETTNRVGFRTVTPSTTFHLNGGAAFKYVTAVANYVFDSGATPDYIVYADVNGINITIPDAATNDARIVVVKNRVGAASSINIVSGGGLIEGAAGDTIVNSLAGVYNTKAYQSDGTNWNRIW